MESNTGTVHGLSFIRIRGGSVVIQREDEDYVRLTLMQIIHGPDSGDGSRRAVQESASATCIHGNRSGLREEKECRDGFGPCLVA